MCAAATELGLQRVQRRLSRREVRRPSELESDADVTAVIPLTREVRAEDSYDSVTTRVELPEARSGGTVRTPTLAEEENALRSGASNPADRVRRWMSMQLEPVHSRPRREAWGPPDPEQRSRRPTPIEEELRVRLNEVWKLEADRMRTRVDEALRTESRRLRAGRETLQQRHQVALRRLEAEYLQRIEELERRASNAVAAVPASAPSSDDAPTTVRAQPMAPPGRGGSMGARRGGKRTTDVLPRRQDLFARVRGLVAHLRSGAFIAVLIFACIGGALPVATAMLMLGPDITSPLSVAATEDVEPDPEVRAMFEELGAFFVSAAGVGESVAGSEDSPRPAAADGDVASETGGAEDALDSPAIRLD